MSQFWTGVDRARRNRIKRAVQRGEAVFDPRDAELAVEWSRLVQRRTHEQRQSRLSMIGHGVFLATGGAVLVFLARHGALDLFMVGLFACTYAGLLHMRYFLRRLGRRAARAEHANLAVLGRDR